MTASHGSLEQTLHDLQQENQALRDEIARRDDRAAQARAGKIAALKFGVRVLIPLLDRQKVVRSFSRLASTAARFAGPSAGWPTRDAVLTDARVFMESCVRFVIRRRMFLLLFSLIAATIPVFQLYLVIKQNDIIEQQNKFIEIQLSEAVNSAVNDETGVSGALLANADIDIMRKVVAEVLDPQIAQFVPRDEGVHARRRLEDAALRGSLVRAVARGVQQRGLDGVEPEDLYGPAHAMFERVLADASQRLPQVFRLSASVSGVGSEEERAKLIEQLDNYIYYVGLTLKVYGQLSRAVGREKRFFADIARLIYELSRRRDIRQSMFGEVYQTAMEEFLFDLASRGKFGRRDATLDGKAPDETRRQGLQALRAGVGDRPIAGKRGVDWETFTSQLEKR